MLDRVKTALLTVTDKVYRYHATGMTGTYIVWAEDGAGDAVWADGEMQEQVIGGAIHLFTKKENDSLFHAVQQALSDAGISYRWESTTYEQDTKYIHHVWAFEVG